MNDPVASEALGSARSPAARRTAARLAAVQGLYQMAVTGLSADVLIDEFNRYRFGSTGSRLLDEEVAVEADSDLFAAFVRGVTAGTADLDSLIAGSLSDDLAIDRLEILIRTILRVGAYELEAMPETPARVVIDEYVGIASAFYETRETALINGVLDGLARRLRVVELGAIENEPAPR